MKKITAIAIAIMMTVTMVTSTAALDSSSADLQNEPAAPGISSVSEIENAPAENLALYGTVIVDSVSTDYPDSVANNANDGDYFTDWRSNSVGRDGDDAWIGIKFEEPTAIAKLKIVWGDAYPLEGGYRVEVSQDGEEWTEASFAAERSSNELTESFDDNIELVGSYTVKCVRVVCYNSNDKGYPIVCEFEVYGESYRFPVSITQQPTETIVPVGSTASTSVAAIGDGLTYQWYYKNPGKTTFMKSSVTEPEYSYTMTEAKSGRQVYCVVTDMCGNSVTTDTVVLRAKTLWDYTVNYDGRAIITKYSGNESHVVVPSVIDGFPVWKIGERAFSANQDIISVDISYGITWIDICAFGFCYNLKSVNIPDSIIFIRNNAFYQCYSLENVDVPASVVDIGSTVFCDCTSLKVITIRGDLIGIGTGVFDNVMVAPSSTAFSATFHAIDCSFKAPKIIPFFPFNKL